MVFAREISDPLTSLVKKVNTAAIEYGGRGLDTFVIFCNDDSALEGKLKAVVEKEEIYNTAISVTRKVPAGYKLPADADVTVYLFVKQSAQVVFTFSKEALTAKAVEQVVDAIDAKMEQPFPIGYIAPAYSPARPIRAGSYGADKEAMGPNPNILIFARETSEPLAIIARKVDEIARQPANQLDSFVVLVGEGKTLEASLKELAEKNKLRNTTLSVEPASAVRAFRVSKSNDITILVSDNGGSKGFYTFKVKDFNDRSCDKLLADLDKVIQGARARK